MKRVLYICTGNICRSPIAEVVGRQQFADLGLEFRSAGLQPVPGHGASQFSAEFVDELGLDLDNHRSRGISAEDLLQSVWVIGMTRSHAAIFRSRHGERYAGRIGVLGAPGVDLARRTHSPALAEVADPYGCARERYFAVGRQITDLVAGWRPHFESLKETEQE